MISHSPSPLSVLLVDDAADTREIYAAHLEFEGFRVECAVDGREGLKKAHTLRPDVIVLDLSLPVVDGWTLCQTLKGTPLTQEIPVIALSGYADEKSRGRAQEAGVDAFLSKPCLPERLVEEIQRRVAARRPSSAPGSDCARCGGVIDAQDHVVVEHGEVSHAQCLLKQTRELIDESRLRIAESHARTERNLERPGPGVRKRKD